MEKSWSRSALSLVEDDEKLGLYSVLSLAAFAHVNRFRC